MWLSKLAAQIKLLRSIQISRNYAHVTKALKPSTSECSDVNQFKLGENYHGFVVKDIKDIKDFAITAIYLQHKTTEAQYLHLYRNDNNNVFSVNFRTTPMNSTGLPHILEHTVLCGSKLYPISDPFFKMLNRSLATFMNAMTGSDYTLYPFSTQNLTDFRNLQRIYLDAAFRPILSELDFMQEGWRLENVELNNKDSELIIKGVVYNEMKGVFSENENILAQKIQNLILPDHTYGVVSGGDPMEIPNLTWEDLKQFHRNHYHPSNARFYSYGNFPLLPSLEYINKEYLQNEKRLDASHTLVPAQKRWSEIKKAHITGRYEKMRESAEKQHSISISLLLSDISNIYETFVMQFLSELLLKGPNSPFYKSMIEPNFSGGYTTSTGFDNQPRDTVFTVGLQGLKKDDFDKVIELFDKTLDKVIESGFTKEHIESVLHRYELSLKHEIRNFGINLLLGISSTWNHTPNIINALEINKQIDVLRDNLETDEKYLQNLVKKHFKENKHRLILTMSPDENFEKKAEEEEKKLLKEKTRGLSKEKRQEIYQKCLDLEKKQSLVENVDILPTLCINDISTEVEKVSKDIMKICSVDTQINKVNSNGIIYFKSLISITDLTQEQQMLLPLFCFVINKLGTDKINYREFDNLINLRTAGLNLNNHIGNSLYHLHTYEPAVLLSSYCLEKNCDAMFDLWQKIFNIYRLDDVQRFQMLINLYMTNLTQGIADSGHIYAMQAAAGLVSGSAYHAELLSGLHHIAYMKRLVHTSNYKAMLDEIVNIAKLLFDRRKMRVAFNLSDDFQKIAVKSFEKFLSSIPVNCDTPLKENNYVTGKVWAPTDAINCEHYVLNIPVNYCSKAVLTVPYTDEDYARIAVLAKLLTSKYLHPELREKQGAYGGGARLSRDGVLSFYSYRDPRSVETLDVFDGSVKFMREAMDKITDQDVFEAKLRVFQEVDAPVPPSHKGCDEFLVRLTPDMLQRHRAALLAVDKKGIIETAEKYLSDSNVCNTGKVILGPKNEKVDVQKRNEELWTIVDNI